MRTRVELRWLLASHLAIFAALGVAPSTDRFTWFMENLPILIGVPILVATRNSFPLSRLVLRLLWLHAIVLMVGGYYSYAQVPLFNWIRDAFGLARNHYDRLGHFAQGFVPAMLIREVLLRKTALQRGRAVSILTIAGCLAFSALYELIEWWTALATGDSATAFLGTQGDPWDTQWDMFMALIGATTSVLLLSRPHDRSIEQVRSEAPPRRVGETN